MTAEVLAHLPARRHRRFQLFLRAQFSWPDHVLHVPMVSPAAHFSARVINQGGYLISGCVTVTAAETGDGARARIVLSRPLLGC